MQKKGHIISECCSLQKMTKRIATEKGKQSENFGQDSIEENNINDGNFLSRLIRILV